MSSIPFRAGSSTGNSPADTVGVDAIGPLLANQSHSSRSPNSFHPIITLGVGRQAYYGRQVICIEPLKPILALGYSSCSFSLRNIIHVPSAYSTDNSRDHSPVVMMSLDTIVLIVSYLESP